LVDAPRRCNVEVVVGAGTLVKTRPVIIVAIDGCGPVLGLDRVS